MDFNPKPYGCHNRAPFNPTVYVEGEPLRLAGRVYPTVKESYPFKMERKCQYTLSNLGQIDPGCFGCRHRKEISS